MAGTPPSDTFQTAADVEFAVDGVNPRLFEVVDDISFYVQVHLENAFINLQTVALDAGRPELADRINVAMERFAERYGKHIERYGGNVVDKSDPVRYSEVMKGQQVIYRDTLKEITDLIRSDPEFKQELTLGDSEPKKDAVAAAQHVAMGNIELKDALELLDVHLIRSGYLREASLDNQAIVAPRAGGPKMEII